MNPNTQLLPAAFLNRMQQQLGNDFNKFLESYEVPSPVSVRVNPNKVIDKFISNEKVLWANNAYYLPERISFTLDPLFHAGCYYVQEASSMFLETAFKSAVNMKVPLKVLDLCAAPGGKSTHLLSFLPNESVLVSNEIIPSRNKILQQNIIKWGYSNAVVTQNNPSDFNRLPSYFDVIIIDAPCSGEGLFRKDPKATNEWSEQAVDRCASRQTGILDDVMATLKKDGVLIYSTCTYEVAENDEQIRQLIESHDFELLKVPVLDGMTPTEYGVQFYPHRLKGEGFYLAMLRKKNSQGGNINYGKPEYSSKFKQVSNMWLNKPDDFVVFNKDNELYAIPEFMKQDFTLLMKNLYVRLAGVNLGELMKNELVPSHQLALFSDNANVIPVVNLNLDQALAFLRGEAISLPDQKPGWYITKFDGFALGWIKALGNRINNYYPKESRILMRG